MLRGLVLREALHNVMTKFSHAKLGIMGILSVPWPSLSFYKAFEAALPSVILRTTSLLLSITL